MTTAPCKSLILASTSTYRRALLGRLGLPFAVHDPLVDEQRRPDEPPAAMVERLSRAKAAAPAAADAIVIGSDQCAVLGNRLLGKPGSVAAATAQLQRSAGQTVTFLTGLCVRSAALTGYCLDQTQVTFRDLSDAEIAAYLAKEPALDCAGSFKAEGLGICLFDAVTSNDPTALQGLPLIALARLLRAQGVVLP